MNTRQLITVTILAVGAAFLLIPKLAQALTNYEPYSVATLAGFPPGSVDGTGTGAQFNEPNGVAVDTSGNVYVADSANNTIRKITSAGVVTTLAGLAGSPGTAEGTGTAAQFSFPSGVAVDTSGNVYVADTNNCTVREITPAGVVTTPFGSAGVCGSADGTGTAAQFNSPTGVAVDTSGNIYVADFGNGIRKITPAGVVTTLATSFVDPVGVAVDTSSPPNIYVADYVNQTIDKVTPAGVVTTLAGSAGVGGSANGTGTAAQFGYPAGVAVDATGNVYVADVVNNAIRMITPAGVVTTLAGVAGGNPGTADGTGSAAQFHYPSGVAVDNHGNVYVADTNNATIRTVTTPAGVVTTLAGSAAGSGYVDGTGSAARFFQPAGIAVDANGNTYVQEQVNETIRKITPAGVVTTLAGSVGNPGSADGTGTAAQFNFPCAVAVDINGNVYVADAGNSTIRAITPAGVVTTLAGSVGVSGSADGTGTAALFNNPHGIAVDTNSPPNVYVGDSGNNTIRAITPAGIVTTLAGSAGVTGSADGTGAAAQFNFPAGVAVDASGNVYVADEFNRTIRTITPAGVVTTLAGLAGHGGSGDGTGSNARFRHPRAVAVDTIGNVYVADNSSNLIRKITSAGIVTTLAGLDVVSGAANGTGYAALFFTPNGVAVDSAGNVYVSDLFNNTIRIGNSMPPPLATSSGSSVVVNTGTIGIASVNLTFPQVTTAGTTTVTLINPASAGSLPSGYELNGAGIAYEIATTATYTAPIIIAFQVPNVDPTTFSQVRVLHNENGTLVDRTNFSGDPGYPATPAPNTVYASVTSLSPFVIATRPPVSGSTSKSMASFNGTAINKGNYIWFNSALVPSGIGSKPVTFRFRNQTITSSKFTLPVPNGTVTFDPKATSATITFSGGMWVTRVPSFGLAGNTFLSSLSYLVPANLQGGIKNVTWAGTFTSDTPSTSLQWQWGAAVYEQFSSDYTTLGVKPVDDNKASQYKSADHAGTPENFKSKVIGGATGGGGSNYTGGYGGTVSVGTFK